MLLAPCLWRDDGMIPGDEGAGVVGVGAVDVVEAVSALVTAVGLVGLGLSEQDAAGTNAVIEACSSTSIGEQVDVCHQRA